MFLFMHSIRVRRRSYGEACEEMAGKNDNENDKCSKACVLSKVIRAIFINEAYCIIARHMKKCLLALRAGIVMLTTTNAKANMHVFSSHASNFYQK